MHSVKRSGRQLILKVFPLTAKLTFKLLALCLVAASVPIALYVRVDSKSSQAAVTVQAGRGGSHLNAQEAQALRGDYRGEQSVIQAMQSGQAKARTLAAVDLDGDATPDLLAGYAYGGTGIVTIQRGNPEAFAPKDESVYQRMHDGYNPNSLLPTAETYQVPVAADFLQTGDFNNDGRKDIVVGAQGGDLYLLAGDSQGIPGTPQQVLLPGVVTAVTAGEFRAPDGRTDLAVGVDGPAGPQVLIYDGVTGVSGEPMVLALASRATGLEFSEMDQNPFMGLAIATGSELEIVHGWGRKTSASLASRIERIDTGTNVRGLASGFFVWSREGSKQLAALGDDGTISVFGQGTLNTQPLSDEEKMARGRLRLQQKRTAPVDIEMLTGWNPGQEKNWTKSRELVTGKSVGSDATAQNLLRSAHISFTETDDLMILGGGNKLDIVNQVDPTKSAPASATLIGGDFAISSLDSADAPATLALPQKLNGWRDLVVMGADSVAPNLVPLAPTATITVDRIDDPPTGGGGTLAAASVCSAALNDCSLRGAVQFANANAGTVINLGAATYTLNTSGNRGCVFEGLTGNTMGDLEITPTTTFTGISAASTIVNQIGIGAGSFPGDRVLCMDVDLSVGHTYTFSAMTIAGGRDFSGLGGGGFLGGAVGTSLSLTNVTFANNQTNPGTPQGPVAGGGVGISGGNMTVTSCTFGAANNPNVTRTSVTLGNASNTLGGGGLSYSAFDPKGVNGAAATLTITGTTFTHNTSSSVSGGGAGLDIYETNVSASTVNISTSAFNNNSATGTASGGGIFNEGVASLTIATTSFDSNSAGNRGGGLYVAGGLGTFLNGTTPSITFANNTATTAGSSISAAGAVTLSGTNTTIGGDLEITTNGTWTNSVGSAMSPTNFIMTGTANFIGNNSTTNVGGNFNFGSGTFTAGTSTFNFNGSAPAQSITNSSSITFFNLTDSNLTNPLTLNNSFAIAAAGSLNVNGANAILAPIATAVISGGGSLTGTGTARVTRTGADSFFTQYAMTGGRTLTNLTVEYIGAAAQTASTTTYSNLKINNASGVTLNAGNTIVNNTLTLQTGALAVSTNTLTINNGITVVGGTLTSAATGTVNYNQGSAGQGVIAGTYGNLTFSAFTKVLASTGTIGIAGTFNVNGVTTGHTIAGSTIDFNGAGAQTVPVFNFNNLTISGARGGATVTLANGTIGVANTFNPSATAVVYSFVGNTIDFNGAGAQTIPAFNYNNLTISGARAVAITLGTGNVGIAGVFNPSITGNTWTANATNIVVFNGAALQTIPAFAFFNGLTLSNAAGASLGGNVTVLNGLVLNAGALGVGTNTLTLNGAASFGAGTLTSSPTGTVIYNQSSNGQATVLAANYGNLTFSNFNKTLASTGTIGIAGTFTPGTATGHTITGSTINFNAAGAQTIPGFTYNNLTSTGAVARTLDPVNTIKIAGVFTPGASTYTITGSTIEYNGSAAQVLPGAFLQYNNVTFNNPTTVTGGPATLDVNGNLQITQGTFAAGGSLSITVGGNWTNNGGTFSPSTGDVTFDGGAGQAIGGTAATTFNNLSVGNASGLAMNNDNTVNANLALVGSDITVAATKTLTQPAAGTSSGAFDVIGSVKHVTLTVGACPAGPCANTETFGNPNNQITVTLGTAPTDITMNLVKSAPVGFASAVTRTYTITPTGGVGIKATLRLHYLDSELNGNVEAQLNLRRFNGTGWAPYLASAADPTTNNWVESNTVFNFSPWTLSSLAPTAAAGVINGRITDNNGNPVAGAVVRLSGTQNRKFITDADGFYRFENVEANGFYTVTPARANYTFSPAERSFTQNAQSIDAAFAGAITNSELVNPLDTPEYFVRQQYLDFLGREPDEAGFNFWSDQILACGADGACVDFNRQHVSAAYFFSIEFQETGGLVDSLNRVSFGAAPQYGVFVPDTKAIGAGLVVGKEGWQTTLEANKQAFVADFVNRQAFHVAYDGMTNGDYVDALISHTGVAFTSDERDALVEGLTQNTMTRGGVLRSIAENNRFVSAKLNETFVMMEYFGYLRRQPDANGFAFWLDKLNHYGGNFEQAEMVKAFIVSAEYRDRFPR
jgi:hypothetical protein